jgi:hypothetical protein
MKLNYNSGDGLMKQLKATAFIIMSAVFCLLLVQPGTGKDKAMIAEDSAKADITGTWKGKGSDTRGVTWEFTFTLTQKGEIIEGESSWEGSDGSTATSTIKGTVNIAKKTFILNDIDLNDVSGDVAAGTYTGSFSADFQKMKGRWTIPNGGSPGKFEAVKEQ